MYGRGGGTGGGAGGGGTGGRGRGHRPASSIGGSLSGRTAELTSAYASLAVELTKKEIKSVGGYTIGRMIGQGSFGKVYIGVHRLTNTRVAIKQVPKSLPFTNDPSSPLSLLTREIHHHRRLRHPHILALYEVIATESSIYLITELCTGGELFDYLVEKGRLSSSETRKVFGQLCLGVSHLHGKGVVHRDLKLENVLLDERVNVKICDLGFGREFEKGRWMDTWVGSLGYSAPEMVGAKRYLGEEVDIWSLGVILFTLLTGSLPFDDDDEGVMKTKILACDYDIPAWLDEDAADLIRNILQLDPLRRLSLKSILAHPFFTRPPSQPTFDRSPSEFNYHLPEAIPEEANSPSVDEGSLSHYHPLSTNHPSSPPTNHQVYPSDISDSSFFSASSDSDLGGDGEERRNRSGATTPVTSDEASSSVLNLLEKTVTATTEKEIVLGLHRNESQSTITRKDEVEEGTTPRGRRMMSTPDTPHSLIPLSATQLSAPALQRNISSSSSVASLSGSPVPIHARTPSRTKRHSVGSIFSERLFPLDEEQALPVATRIDYLSLLSKPIPSPLSTPSEKQLLDALTTLGFDTGQIVHSVMMDACDASGAVWWMLKRKADEKEKELEEELEDETGTVSAKKKRDKHPRSPALLQNMFDELDHGEDDGEDKEGEIVNLVQTPPPLPLPTIVTPPPPLVRDDGDEEEDDNNVCYFLHQNGAGSVSALLLPYFPPVDSPSSGSPTRRQPPRSKSKDHIRSPPHEELQLTPPLLSSPSFLSPSPKTPLAELVAETASGKKRSRSTSVSMLQRAASAVGNSLALKKSTDGVSTPEDGRSTPTIAGLFHRKSSLPDELNHHAGSQPSSPPLRGGAETIELPASIPGTPSRRLQTSTPPQHSPAISDSGSHDTFDTIASDSKSKKIPTISNTPIKKDKGGKGNLFSNFKMWFGDDRRKGKKRNSSGSGGSSFRGTGSLPETSTRGSGSIRRRPDGSYVNSPLVKPPLGSRRSSNGSIIPPSRQSSLNSMHRGGGRDAVITSPSLGHHRRRSDSSRTSTSDLDHSRPPSIRSTSGHDSRKHQHVKTGSVGSSNSFRPTLPKDVYRRPPTTTTVRRHHGSSGRHSRNRSAGSSITRHSSSSSIGAEDANHDEQTSAEAAILEEDETGDEVRHSPSLIQDTPRSSSPRGEARLAAEREKALKKLSGEFGSQIKSQETLHHSRPSRDSLDSHSGRHSPIIFSAHKTRHVFGAPSQPSAHSIGRKSSHSTLRPPLRDIFAPKEGDAEWVDESDDLGGYGGGLGQASTRSGHRPDSEASTSSSLFSSFSSAHSTIPSSASNVSSERESFEFPPNSGGSYLFEGRYAGLAAVQPPEPVATASGPWRGTRPPAFRSAAVIEEDEEDED